MDWHTWLSKTSIDPVVAYKYAVAFTRNELQVEDLSHFNHEFLQSVGISVAKHRLEILKLAKKEAWRRGKMHGLSRLVMAVNQTRKLLARNIGKWGFNKSFAAPQPSQWSGALKRVSGSTQKGHRPIRGMMGKSNVMWSGPLDGRVQDRLMWATNHSVSGPLDENGRSVIQNNWKSSVVIREKMGLFSKSPTICGSMEGWTLSPKMNYCNGEMMVIDNHDDHEMKSLWSLMFQDMKPT